MFVKGHKHIHRIKILSIFVKLTGNLFNSLTNISVKSELLYLLIFK